LSPQKDYLVNPLTNSESLRTGTWGITFTIQTITSGNQTPRINQLVLGYLLDISEIGQGYDRVLDIPGISFQVKFLGLRYP
jgi:hypothetical protein